MLNTTKNCFYPTWQSAVCVHQWPVKERCLFSFQMSTQKLGATKQITRDHTKDFLPAKQRPACPYSWRPASPPSICNCALTCANTKQDPRGSMHPKPQKKDNPCSYCLSRPAQLSKKDSGLEVWNANVCRGWMANASLHLDVTLTEMEREYKKLPHAHLSSFPERRNQMKAEELTLHLLLISAQDWLRCNSRWYCSFLKENMHALGNCV